MDYPHCDRWGRPIIKVDGEDVVHTRVTTVAKALDDMNGLMTWKAVMAMGGVTLQSDLRAQVAANWPRTEKTKGKLNSIMEKACDAAQASFGANMGDALHEGSARLHRGEDWTPIPPLDKDLAALDRTLEKAGIEILPEYVELTCVLAPGGPEPVAGSFDRIIGKAGQLVIADLKTGQDLGHSWPSIAIQMALYSRAKTLYDWDRQEHREMPPVNQKQGLVIWLPAGSAKCSLHVVDLEAGWQAAQQAFWVREWRKRKDIVREAKAR